MWKGVWSWDWRLGFWKTSTKTETISYFILRKPISEESWWWRRGSFCHANGGYHVISCMAEPGNVRWLPPRQLHDRLHTSSSKWFCIFGHNFAMEMSSFWYNFHHRLHWKLSFWQLPEQPVMKISSKWQHLCFNGTYDILLQKKSLHNLICCSCDRGCMTALSCTVVK